MEFYIAVRFKSGYELRRIFAGTLTEAMIEATMLAGRSVFAQEGGEEVEEITVKRKRP